jgi:hypothetical protein
LPAAFWQRRLKQSRRDKERKNPNELDQPPHSRPVYWKLGTITDG